MVFLFGEKSDFAPKKTSQVSETCEV